MKAFKLLGLAVSLLGFAGTIQAQNSLQPGQLATSSFTRSSFDSEVDASPVMPKQRIASVESSHDKRVRAIWVGSMAAMLAGTAVDAYTSWHRQESNGLLASSNGTFGAKGVAIKAGIASGVLVPQIIFRKHKDWRAAFAASNFIEAGIFAGAAAYNKSAK